MSDPVPLYYWPPDTLTAGNRERMWQSKGRVDTDLKVVPKPAEAGCGRTLSFGGYPPFAVEVAFVQDSSVEGLRDAISWVMFLSEDSRAVSMERVLSKMFGRKVVEV